MPWSVSTSMSTRVRSTPSLRLFAGDDASGKVPLSPGRRVSSGDASPCLRANGCFSPAMQIRGGMHHKNASTHGCAIRQGFIGPEATRGTGHNLVLQRQQTTDELKAIRADCLLSRRFAGCASKTARSREAATASDDIANCRRRKCTGEYARAEVGESRRGRRGALAPSAECATESKPRLTNCLIPVRWVLA